MLTHQGAHGGEGVVLADQANGVGVAPLPHQGDVAGGIDVGGTQLHAGDALEVGGAAALVHVGQVVVLEGYIAVQNHLGSLEADGAVGAVHDGVGRAENGVQVLLAALAVQQAVQQVSQTVQTDPAGDALAAALGKT